MILGIAHFDKDGENQLADFTAESAFWGEEGSFDQLLGDGRATFNLLASQSSPGGPGDTLERKAGVLIELGVFDGNDGLTQLQRNVVEFD